MGRAVVARRAPLRRARPRRRAIRDSTVGRGRRRGHRCAHVPHRAAPQWRPHAGRTVGRRRVGRALHAVVGASAPARRALPPPSCVAGRGAGLADRPSPDAGAADRDVALGERAWLVRAGVRVSRAAPRRPLDRRPPSVGGTRAPAAHRFGRCVRSDLREPVRRVARDVPDPPHGPQRHPAPCRRVGVTRLPPRARVRVRAVDRGLCRRPRPGPEPGVTTRPGCGGSVSVARVLGVAQRRDRATRRVADRGAGRRRRPTEA